MAKLTKTGLSLALAAGILAAAPAGAVKDLSGKGSLPTSNVTLFGATHTVDNNSLGDKITKRPIMPEAISAVPEPANWLMMVIGFGLLGGMNRRSNLDRWRDEMVF